MKILFLFPQIHADFSDMSTIYSPLTLECLAASVSDIADVNFLDCRGHSLYQSKKFNEQYKGVTINQTIDKIGKICPNVIASTIPYSFTAPSVLDNLKHIKNAFPSIKIWVGGFHVTYIIEETLNSGAIDVVVRGEGDEIIRNLVLNNGSPNGIKGCSYRDNSGEIVNNPLDTNLLNTSKLRKPFRDFFDPKHYTFFGEPAAVIETSRGCPYCCTFCSISAFSDHRWRGKKPVNVINEMEELIDRFSVSQFLLADPNIFANINHVNEICGLIKERNLKVRIFSPGRVDTMANNLKLLEKMAEAGFYMVHLGVESASQKNLDSSK